VSTFVRNLNQIKTHCDTTWLSPSQRRTLDVLFDAIRYPGTVNLWGSVGVGKTFVSWILSNESGATYIPHISFLNEVEAPAGGTVIVDNCPPDRTDHRTILNRLRFANIPTTVLVSRDLIQDYTRYSELLCTSEDIDRVRSNLASVGVFSPKANVPNLWHLVNSYSA
jgi:hypothetical protein